MRWDESNRSLSQYESLILNEQRLLLQYSNNKIPIFLIHNTMNAFIIVWLAFKLIRSNIIFFRNWKFNLIQPNTVQWTLNNQAPSWIWVKFFNLHAQQHDFCHHSRNVHVVSIFLYFCALSFVFLFYFHFSYMLVLFFIIK